QRIALVTDSASDLPPELVTALDATVVPLLVYFGDEEIRASDLPPAAFWDRMTQPGAPLPRTSACSPADFLAAFQACFDGGAEAIICVTVGGKLSATLKSAQIAAQQLAPREIHVIDSDCASMGEGLLLQVAAALRDAGEPAAAIAERTIARAADLRFYVVLETLEYLRRGGRISGAQAAIGSVLSVKPIITIKDGVVEALDRVRTRSKARERVLELITARPLDRVAILHADTTEIGAFREEVMARSGLAPDRVSVAVIGPSIGPHVGPGAYGAVCLYRPS
ncbi:MAG TPA: DegV family protein, partial [Candidatus Sulfotelmatobacter sp.]|nr:DegV family protein [Candidatus Sulfotelmatobacter sp.]